MIQYNGMKAEIKQGVPKQLPAGAYVAKVLKVQIDGKEPDQQLVIFLDIAEGEYTDFYMNKYRAQTERGSNYKITYKGIIRLRIPNPENKNARYPESDISRFNDMIGRFERSNPGFQWDGDEQKLQFKLIGISVQEDSYNGSTFTKPVRFEIVDDVREGKVATLPPKHRDDDADPTPAPMVDQRSGMQMVQTESLPWDQPF